MMFNKLGIGNTVWQTKKHGIGKNRINPSNKLLGRGTTYSNKPAHEVENSTARKTRAQRASDLLGHGSILICEITQCILTVPSATPGMHEPLKL
jgi:hypothetical protein